MDNSKVAKIEYNESDPLGPRIKKDSTLISAKYRSTLFEEIMLNTALTRLTRSPETGTFYADIYPGDLRFFKGDNSKSIYNKLKSIGDTMTGHTMIREYVGEDGKQAFDIFPIVQRAKYENGCFHVVFSEGIKDLIDQNKLESNYTQLYLGTITSFKHRESLRLYEILKKECFKLKWQNPVEYRLGLAELCCMIGLANVDLDDTRKKIASYKGNAIDWEEVYRTCKEVSYRNEKNGLPRFNDIKRKVLDRAQEEMAAISDITFEYETIKKDKRVSEIVFWIRSNSSPSQSHLERIKNIQQPDTQLTINEVTFPKLYEFEGHNYLSRKDLDKMLEVSGYNEELVIAAINDIDAYSQKNEVKNYVGAIIDCIKQGGYNKPIPVIDGFANKAENIQTFLDQMNEDRDRIALNVWEKCKLKEGFDNFLRAVDMDVTEIEIIYTEAEKRVQLYYDWRAGRL